MDFTVISFYTNDWLYPEYADSLRRDCHRLNLKYQIEPRPSTNRYVGNCQIKPFFIQECLLDIKSPVFWIDADASILKSPDILKEQQNADHDLLVNKPNHDDSRVHVGSMWLNYTDAMIAFVDVWCQGILRKNPLDDAAFNGTWDNLKSTLRTRFLPPTYFYIEKRPQDPVPPDTVILHRLSKSELKQRYKKGER